MKDSHKPKMLFDDRETLYKRWKYYRYNGLCGPEFMDFDSFRKWAFETGYKSGVTLRRRDKKKPISPENCYWSDDEPAENRSASYRQVAKAWDETVARIRKHYGLPPLVKEMEGQDDGKEEPLP